MARDRLRTMWGIASATLCVAGSSAGAGAETLGVAPIEQFRDLSLEELSNIQVTSVSRRAERLSDAAASIYVITADDIRRSGAISLPEALRLAPNLQVARVNVNSYAISSRGFNNSIGNKLLVLIDGRTVYSALFSGVFWDAQDVALEDIERIEVISGPGATLWGANAVNGVINVITRAAGDTQGVYAGVQAGNGEANAVARFGGTLGAEGRYRVYAMGIDRKHTDHQNGTALDDDSRKRQAGFRADWGKPTQGFTVQGDVYRAGADPGVPESPKISGANLVARWSGEGEGGSSWRLQAYYEHTKRDEFLTFRDELDVADVEFQHAPAMPEGHRLLWGGGYRQARDKTQPSLLVAFIPAERDLRWASLFVQDDITLGPNLELTLGAKVEHNIYTGAEFLPNLRLAWKPSETQLAWSSLSRAVRAPARIDREFFLPGRPPFFILGGPDFVSEVANVLEVGYRANPTAALAYSATLFYADYDRLRSGAPAPAQVQNQIEGDVSGLEAWGSYQVTPSWRLRAGVTALHKDLKLKPGSRDPSGPRELGNDPRHQVKLRSSYNLGDRHELDLVVRHIGALPDPAVPSYTAVDARWGWRVTREVELSLIGRNLFGGGHIEYAPSSASEWERGVFLQVSVRL